MKKFSAKLLSIVIVVLFILPVIYTLFHSFMDSSQILSSEVTIIPEVFNIQQYYSLIMNKPEYFRLYINSIIIVVSIIVGQLLVSVCAAYYFSRHKSRFSQTLFVVYIFIMLLPLQITLIPNVFLYNGIEHYIGIKIFDTHMAIILPGIFSTIGVFFLKQFFDAIPEDLIEMATIDGASKFQILTKIVVPYSKNAIIALCLLNFVENWNMIEQGLIFINTMSKMPLSVYLNTIYSNSKEIFFAAGVLFMFPVIFVIVKSKDIIKNIMFGK